MHALWWSRTLVCVAAASRCDSARVVQLAGNLNDDEVGRYAAAIRKHQERASRTTGAGAGAVRDDADRKIKRLACKAKSAAEEVAKVLEHHSMIVKEVCNPSELFTILVHRSV
jgi:hypothetical protein